MSTLSVPLDEELIRGLENLVRQGVIPNKAEGARQALRKYLEDQAVQDILNAMKEPDLEGDFDELIKKF